jgi:hypothetical protein
MSGQALLTEIIDYFATKDEGLGDMWAHPDDFSSYGLDYRNRDGTQLWIDLDKDGTITVLWKRPDNSKVQVKKFTVSDSSPDR